MKIIRFFKKTACWLAFLGICAYTLVFVLPNFFYQEKQNQNHAVLTLWHVDSFEGGKGSRAAFLKSIARRYQETGGAMILVSAKTGEGVRDAWRQGERPDLLSFGGYAPVEERWDDVACWCYGKYVLYSLGSEEAITPENTVISLGGDNLPQVAAAMSGWKGEYVIKNSLEAYVSFLSGKYQYLLGTQRDACRFQSRGVEVEMLAMDAFSDLMQYIVSTRVETKKEGDAFIRYLLSENSQTLLTEIGLFSRYFHIYSEKDELQRKIERGNVLFTLSPFVDLQVRRGVLQCAQDVMNGAKIELLKKFLKSV